jgi:Mg-chelatase subunit ChlD
MPTNKYARETAASTLLSGVHDRERRNERGIQKVDLQRARRYGMAEKARNGMMKYTYGGVVFIYNPRTKAAVTSWTVQASQSSGTKVAQPILLEKYSAGGWYQNNMMIEKHEKLTRLLSTQDMKMQWASHSVLIVDMSGSMRSDDVNGARCRSDGVFMALARDYVKDQLQKGLRSSRDLVSVVVMKEDAEVIIQCEPTSWVLYNKLIDFREWTNLRPSGHGFYNPAIDKANELLSSNTNANCALSLLFFSDGKPSDPPPHSHIVDKVGQLASKFGRRLSISCIGMADESEDFSTLHDMVSEAKQYGAMASFGKPSLDADSLSNVITSLASSLTTSRTEMTELKTGRQKTVRMDIEREKYDAPDWEGTWKNYTTDDSQYVRRFWTWDHKRNVGDWVEIIDRRCRFCFSDIIFNRCVECRAAFTCIKCFTIDPLYNQHKTSRNNRVSECSSRRTKVAMGTLAEKDDDVLPSFCIAVKDQTFGEGAERVVRKGKHLSFIHSVFFFLSMSAQRSRSTRIRE